MLERWSGGGGMLERCIKVLEGREREGWEGMEDGGEVKGCWGDAGRCLKGKGPGGEGKGGRE